MAGDGFGHGMALQGFELGQYGDAARQAKARPVITGACLVRAPIAPRNVPYMFDRANEFGGRVNVQRKVLVVEDDRLIAMELEERLVEFGHAVLGPAHTIEEAEALLAGERSEPLDEAQFESLLDTREIPDPDLLLLCNGIRIVAFKSSLGELVFIKLS